MNRMKRHHLKLGRSPWACRLSARSISHIQAHYDAREYGYLAAEVTLFDRPQLPFEELVHLVDGASRDQKDERRAMFRNLLQDLCQEEPILILKPTYLRWRYQFKKPNSSQRRRKTESRAYSSRNFGVIEMLHRQANRLPGLAVRMTEEREGRLLLPGKNLLLIGHDEYRFTAVSDDAKSLRWLQEWVLANHLQMHFWPWGNPLLAEGR